MPESEGDNIVDSDDNIIKSGNKNYVKMDPWQVWPDGIIPAEGYRPELRLRTPEEGREQFRKLREFRNQYPPMEKGFSRLHLLREERDER